MNEKICNQLFVKDTHRNRKFNGTLKCSCCGEESNIEFPYPIEIFDYTRQIDAFVNLHKVKGCNKKQLPRPDWASKEITHGIAFVK